MRKRLVLLLLLKLSESLLHKVIAQSQLSLENYYSTGSNGPLAIMPIASYQTSKGFYAEGRYNYEELNTFSFYMGRSFSKESTFSYSISPIAGIVIGQFNGGSVGANISLGYKNFYLYSQPQYTFAVENSVNNYIYSWTDVTYSPLSWLSVGFSLQHTKPNQSKGFLENGLVLETAFKKFTFPIYIFNPQSKDRSIVLGANFELNFKKKKVSENKKSDSFRDVYPVNIIANSAAEDKKASSNQESEHLTAGVVKVRRVNVVVHTKTDDTEILGHNFKPTQNLNSSSVKPNQISRQQSQLVSNINAGAGTPKEFKSVLAPPAVKSGSPLDEKKAEISSGNRVYYALLLGPFIDEDQATKMKDKLDIDFSADVVVYSEHGKIKIRIPGFSEQKEAESFGLNVTMGLKVASSVVSYKVKNIDAVPLKTLPKPFEATQL